jgi:archaellum component FlaG (FlaF/FlaG flagellin family)
MGMSTISTHLILFIAVLSISTFVVAMFHEQMDSTTNSIKTQQDWLSQQLKTDITISVINYVDSSENQTTIYLENTGATTLDIEQIDVYIGGERILRSNESRTIEILSDTEITNIGLWDPKEKIVIVVNKTLESNKTYSIIVTSHYGGRAVDQFST